MENLRKKNETEIQTKMEGHSSRIEKTEDTPVRIAIIKNTTNNMLVRMWKKRNPHTLLVRMKKFGCSLKIKT
jgi:uncharacterized protein (UPF0128 family)